MIVALRLEERMHAGLVRPTRSGGCFEAWSSLQQSAEAVQSRLSLNGFCTVRQCGWRIMVSCWTTGFKVYQSRVVYFLHVDNCIMFIVQNKRSKLLTSPLSKTPEMK